MSGRTVVVGSKGELKNRFYLVGCFCALVPRCLQHGDGQCCEVIWAQRERESGRELCDQPAMPAMAQKKRRGHTGYMILSLI